MRALRAARASLRARAVRQAQPRLWDFCLKLRGKAADWAEIGQGRPFVHLSGMYPVERGCLAVVWPLAMHPVNKNELIVWDLAHDPAAGGAIHGSMAGPESSDEPPRRQPRRLHGLGGHGEPP